MRLSSVEWPSVCACCGEPATTQVDSRKRLFHKNRHNLPVCAMCAGHVAHWNSGADYANKTGIALYFSGVLFYSATKSRLLGLVFLGSLPVLGYIVHRRRREANAMCGPTCAFAGPPVFDLPGNGVGFTSEAYAVLVARHNGPKLLSAPDSIRAQLPPTAIVVRDRKRE
jgi:hypothetical protein